MNERIKELSDIAYKNHLKNNPESSFGRRTDYDKVFAELIIKECISVCESLSDWASPKGCVEQIKEHFEVECHFGVEA